MNIQKVIPDIFVDHRGTYVETFNAKEFSRLSTNVEFVQDDFSVSIRRVIRGIHGDNKTWKYVTCVFGKIFIAIVDCREGEPTFGEFLTDTITAIHPVVYLVPPGFGLGHQVVSDVAVFHYKQSTYYDPKSQFTFRYDKFPIPWPLENPILSERDRNGEYPKSCCTDS